MDQRRKAVAIWVAFCSFVAAFFVFSLVVPVTPGPARLQPMLVIAAVVAIVFIPASRWLPPKIKPAAATPERTAVKRQIVACGLCEGAALVGIVAVMSTRSPYAIGITVVCYCALLTLYPSSDRWSRLLDG